MLTSRIALGMLITYASIVATTEGAPECLCWNSAYETTVLKAKLYTIPTLRLK